MMRGAASPHQTYRSISDAWTTGKDAVSVMALRLAGGIDNAQHHREPWRCGTHRDVQGLRPRWGGGTRRDAQQQQAE